MQGRSIRQNNYIKEAMKKKRSNDGLVYDGGNIYLRYINNM